MGKETRSCRKLRFLFLEWQMIFQKENGVFRKFSIEHCKGEKKPRMKKTKILKEDLEKILNEKQNSMELETLNKKSKDYYIELQGESG